MNNSLNQIFRLVWSDVQQAWVAVAEIVKGRGKSSRGANRQRPLYTGLQTKLVSIGILSAQLSIVGLAIAQVPSASGVGAPVIVKATDLPTGGNVVAGQAHIATTTSVNGAAMNINQSSQRAIIDWNTFNLGTAASINFNQPNASAATLNRVLDNNPSQIFGRITAPGQVFISNPNGVLFTAGSKVDVGSLTATTHQISNADFMSGNLRFDRQGSSGSVVNQGELRANLGGYIALLAPEVRNDGVVIAQAGSVVMAAGEMIRLELTDRQQLSGITTTPAQIKTLIENRHAVLAPDGLIILSSRALDRLQGGLVKNSGSLEANSLTAKGGRIVLEADAIQIANGAHLDASGLNGGGTILVGGDLHGQGGMANASQVTVEAGSLIEANAHELGDGGKVVVWSDDLTKFKGEINARGGAQSGDGGFVEVSGKQRLQFSGRVNTSAENGQSGTLLLDPANLYIVNGATSTGDQDGNLTGNQLSFGDGDTADNSISVGLLQSLGNSNITLQATNSIVVGSLAGAAASVNLGSLTSNTLTLQAGNGSGGAGNVTFNSGSSITTGNGNVLIVAGQAGDTTGNLVLGGVNVGSGALELRARGAITQNAPFYASSVKVTATNSAVNLSDTGNVFTYLNGVTTTGGSFTLRANQGMVFGDNVNVGSGLVNLNINGSLTFSNHSITAAGLTTRSLSLSMSVSDLTGVTGPIVLEQSDIGANMSMAGSEVFNITSGSIPKLKASGATSVTIGQVGSTGVMTFGNVVDLDGKVVTINAGSISDGNTTNRTVSATTLNLTSHGGDVGGATANNAIDVSVSTLSLHTSGGSAYVNAASNFGLAASALGSGALTLNGAGDITQSGLLTAGNVAITSANNLSLTSSTVAGSFTAEAVAGDLTLNGNVSSTNNGSAILMKTSGDFLQQTGVAVSSTNGAITYHSDSDASGAGGVRLQPGSSVNSTGGNITFGGGANPATGYAYSSNNGIGNGIELQGASVTAGAGNVVMHGHGADTGSYSDGIRLNGASTTLSGADITLVGVGSNVGPDVGRGVDIENDAIVTATGAMIINGTGGALAGDNNHGISISGSNVQIVATGTGSITMTGVGGGTGASASSYGVTIDSTAIVRSASGAISITGTGASTTGIDPIGVNLNDAEVYSTGGNITVTGTSGNNGATGGSNNAGVMLSSANIAVSGASGNVLIIGTDGNATPTRGIRAAGTTIGATGYAGNVVLRANEQVVTGSSIVTLGSVTLESTSSAFHGAFSTSGWLWDAGISGLTIGKSSNTSTVNFANAWTFNGPILAYGGDINLNAALTLTGSQTATFNATGSINGSSLLTASTVDLNAGTGIGNTAAIHLAASNISADSTIGKIAIQNQLATAVTVSSLSTSSSVNVGSLITFDQTGGGAVSFTHVSTEGTTPASGYGDINLSNTGGNLTIATSATTDSDSHLNLTTYTSGNIILNGTTGSHSGGDGALNYVSAGSISGSGLVTGYAMQTLSAQTGISLAGAIGVDFTSVTTAAGDITLSNLYGFNLPSITAPGNLSLSGGEVVQQGGTSLNVTGTTTINAGGNAIDLSNTGNSFGGAVSLSNTGNRTAQIRAVGALALNTSTIGGSLTAVATGAITDTGNLTVSGTASFDAGTTHDLTLDNTNSFGSLAIVHARDVAISNVSSLGNFAADAASVALSSAGGFTVGTAGGLNGVNATGTVNLSTASGNLTVARSITTTDTSTSAIALNAGKSTAAGTSTGGDILISGSPVFTTGANGRVTLMTGSVSGSTGLTTLVGSGSGRFRYNSDEVATNYASALGSGAYAIYRQSPTITVTANADSKTYDGNAYSGGNGVTYGALVNGDTLAILSGSLSYTGTSQGATNAGAYAITPGGLSNGLGYTVSNVSGTLTVDKAHLTVSADNKSRLYGQANPSLTATITGFISGENLANSGVAGSAGVSTSATNTTSVGTSAITASVGSLSATNYDFTTFNAGTLTIDKAHLTVTADDKSRLYGQANPTLTTTVSGFVNGETLGTSGVTGSGAASTSAIATTGVGTVAIVAGAGTLSANNYDFTVLQNGVLTIDKAHLTVTADDKSRLYGQANPAFTTTVSGFVNGENLATSGVTGSGAASSSATVTTGAGSATILAGAGTLSASNYDFTVLQNGVLTIDKAHLTVTADDKSRLYGQANPTLTTTVSGFVNGETLGTSGVTGSGAASTSAIATTGVGTAAIVAGAGTLSANNYDFTVLQNGVLTIDKAHLTVTADDKSRLYGQANPSLTTTVSGFVNSETLGTSGVTGSAQQAPVP